MTRFIDKNGTAEIEMKVWNGNGYDPDWSADYFNVCSLEYDAEADAYKVDDIDYLVDQALDWKYNTGDCFGGDSDADNCMVFVDGVDIER